MNLLDQLDSEQRDYHLQLMLGISPVSSEPSKTLHLCCDDQQKKQVSVTYNWIWNDEDPSSSEQVLSGEEKLIDEMKCARLQQEQKFSNLISKIKVIDIWRRKAEAEDQTEAGSPKKKRIKKMATIK